jgi:hypothetical protein
VSEPTSPVRFVPTGEKRRGRRLVAAGSVVALVVAGAAGGWFAALRLQSPDQIEAAATAPSPGPITASVVVSDLAETVNAQAEVVRATAQSAAIVLPEADAAVITAVWVAPGATADAGSALVAVNDRPVFALPGTFPLYRDIGRGDTGADVAQLQDGLRAAGYSIRARETGTFGADTARAVRALYTTVGYAPASETVESTEVEQPSAVPTGAEAQVAAAPVTRLVVPRSEIAVVPTLPAVVTGVPGVGTVLTVDNAAVQLATGVLLARAPVAVSVAGRVTAETSVSMTGPDGTVLAGQVAVITPAVDGGQAQVDVQALDGEVPETWLGSSVLTTFVLQVVAEQALVVPTTAVVTSGSGGARVLREEADGSFQEVDVEELGSLSGRTAVRPLDPTALEAGDQVRVD